MAIVAGIFALIAALAAGICVYLLIQIRDELRDIQLRLDPIVKEAHRMQNERWDRLVKDS
jgi:hypothetical protein